MSKPERPEQRLHEDAVLFAEAVRFTAAQTGFSARLIEKDYFCSMLLECLAEAAPNLVFKGGTCLAKVHSGFYRLSEDLDFALDLASDSARSERRRLAKPLKVVVLGLAGRVTGLRVVEPLEGANESTHYSAVLGYSSVVEAGEGTIKLEVGMREPLLTPAVPGAARTLLLDPISGVTRVAPVRINSISAPEAMAEKMRAALSRREPAIRDYYDLDHAVRQSILHPEDAAFLDLVRRKLAVPGNAAPDVSEARVAALRAQLDAQLKPVLRQQDFADFDLDRACSIIRTVALAVG